MVRVMKRWGIRVVLILGVITAAGYGLFSFIRSLGYEKVDDARVAGSIVPIAAEVRGRVVKVHIQENQPIEVGTPLVEISPKDFTSVYEEKKAVVSRLEKEEKEIVAALEERQMTWQQAKAALAAAAAEESLAERDLERQKKLYQEGLITPSQFERAESQLQVARARKEASAAAAAGAETSLRTLEARLATQASRIKEAAISRERARMDLEKTVITAPVGKYIQPGQTLLSIVKEQVWVVANFKETQIKKMAIGQPVRIKVDAYPGKIFHGRVESLQPGTGSVFSLLPPENATGNFIKVVQRIPVKIVVDTPFDPDHPLWPGMSVVPEVDVRRQTGPKLVRKQVS